MAIEFGNPEAVKKAIEHVQSTLNVFLAPQLQAEVEAGLHPNLLTQQSVLVKESPVRVIERYLIGATTFLRQPVNHYDIFAAARCVLMTQLLGEALEIIDAAKIRTAEARMKRLIPVFDSDT